MGLTLGVESSPKNPPSFTPVLNKLSLQCPTIWVSYRNGKLLTGSLIRMLELNRYICARSTVFVDVDDGVVAGVVDVHVHVLACADVEVDVDVDVAHVI